MNFEGKVIKEFVQGTTYINIYFTDGTFVDVDIRGDAFLEYAYGKETEKGEVYFKTDAKP